MFGRAVLCAALALVAPVDSWAQETSQGEGDPYVLAVMNDFNRTLRAEWMDLRVQVQVEGIEILARNERRASSHLHSQSFRWVPGDPRRASANGVLTYLADLSDGLGSSALTPAAATEAIDRATAIWRSADCLADAVDVVKLESTGSDPDLFDSLFGYGDLGDYLSADVVHAGWLPASFFELVAGPGGGQSVVAFSVTFIFVGLDGEPTDIDGDGHLDAAHSEIYYNQGFPWTPDVPGALDPEAVALHEIGHSLGVGHVDKPNAIMNPVYHGSCKKLKHHDEVALCEVWAPE